MSRQWMTGRTPFWPGMSPAVRCPKRLNNPIMSSALTKSLSRYRVRLFDPLLRPILKFWSWWIGELVAALPADIREAIASANRRIIVVLQDDEWLFSENKNSGQEEIARLPADAVELPGDLSAQINELVFALPADKVLQRTLTLPLAAEENLREVLGFEMDRQTPFAAQQVYYDFRVTGRQTATNTITLDLIVSPRKVVDEFLEKMTQLGLAPDTITTQDQNSELVPVNLLSTAMRPSRPFTAPRLNTVLASMCVLLFIVALLLPPLLNKNKVAQLEQEILIAESTGQSGLELRRDVERITRTSEFLTQKKLSSVMVLRILDEATRILPDNTWLVRFDVTGLEIQLQGQSTSASDLIQLLESSPLFKEAQFRSSVVQVPRTDREQFHISMQLESADAT